MGKVRDYFEMTRHERRGAIVVLALIAAVLAATCLMRSTDETEQLPASTVTDIQQFEAEADSAALVVPKSLPRHPAVQKKKRRPASSQPTRPSKPAPAPRRLDPVPQI